MVVMRRGLFCLFCLLLLNGSLSRADELLPSSLIFFDYPGSTVIIIDKSVCRLMVYRYQEKWEMEQSMPCTSGKIAGDKLREGDRKTPNGVYWLYKSWSGLELKEYYGEAANVYGIGAFELTYPNYLDLVVDGKNGDGIWIHGAENGKPVATRGCISLSNPDFLELTRYVELANTPVVIEEEIRYITADDRNRLQQSLLAFVESWRRSWESDDVAAYLDFYSRRFRTAKRDLQSWSRLKRELNQQIDKRKILLSDLSILQSKGVIYVRFLQDYASTNLSDVGVKELYVARENDTFRIISENWSRLIRPQPASLQYAYQPTEDSSM